MKPNYILGISAFYHDSAAVLLKDGQILAAAHEERFTRKKHDPSFPSKSILWCLSYAGINFEDLDIIAFYDKPLLKLERLLDTYFAFAPKGVKSFLAAMPIWIKEKMFIKKEIKDKISEITNSKFPKKLKIIFPEHHLSHAASAFYPSPFEKAAVLTIDGVGEWATASICLGEGNKMKILKQLNFPHSLGFLYSAFTYFSGFKVNSGEYKLMGLAPYGNPESDKVKKFKELVYNELIDVKDDGSLWLNMEYFDFATGLKMIKEEKWEKLFGFPKRDPESELNQDYMDLALAIQNVTENIVLKMAKHAKELTGAKYLTMAGGVALNCVANEKIFESGLFEDIWIQPASSDAGGALGAAYAAYYIYLNKNREINTEFFDKMKGVYLGPEFSDCEIEKTARKFKAVFKKKRFKEIIEMMAKLISDGAVIGWFQGRMEYGPRALGNRSILADARNGQIQKKLNLKIKFRESFRPFAPAVLSEDETDYFEINKPFPYMLFTAPIKKSRRKPLPKNYYQLSLKEKLYYKRSDLPAITHLDYSARVQTVHKETNRRFWELIKTFKNLTGCGVIINTSFNVRGEPIVCAPKDAYKCFMRTEMDYLVIGDYIFDKKLQPEFEEQINWKETYELD